jgi:cytoplasmic iron level regulating protein YaaA (DUF328/UPF0246 family)
MKILVIDQCSKAKKARSTSSDNDLSQQDQSELENTPKYEARDLYEGRQQKFVSDAVDILRENGDEVDRIFISAGYGVVKETEKIPPYKETFAGLSEKEIRERSSELNIQEDVSEILEKQYDLIFFLLGNDYYLSIDMQSILKKIPEEVMTVTFNGESGTNKRQNHVSIPARTQEAKEHGTIVVALKGKYLQNFAEHKKRGVDIQDIDDVSEYCTTEPATQSGSSHH